MNAWQKMFNFTLYFKKLNLEQQDATCHVSDWQKRTHLIHLLTRVGAQNEGLLCFTAWECILGKHVGSHVVNNYQN